MRDGSAEAFIRAINELNAGPMRYYWPYYLPAVQMPSFFEPMRIAIMKNLGTIPILESCIQTLAKPSLLWYVPPSEFMDGEGIPFTLNSATATCYLSPNYPAWTIDTICSLGVRRLSPQQFLQDLKVMIEIDSENFQKRHMSWHAHLARSLVPLTTEPEHRLFLKGLCLIPLQDGSWISAQGKSISFLENSDHLEFLGNLDVLIVDLTAVADLNRRNLFTSLGATHLHASKICRQIVEMHAAPTFVPQSLTRVQLISQVKFLYSASWQPRENIDLWFATSNDERCQGSKLYMQGDLQRETALSRVFK